ncbi:hypothetical protein [Terricaulis sp.]|uniref:hypothetical protein n=1 Tax=Terricaulis sp. TaxID=2768686 RepID=UPI00378420FF
MTDDVKKLVTVMSVDICGFSAMAEIDENAAVAVVAGVRTALEAAAAQHGGRIFSSAGDGFMLEFPSASSALLAAEMLVKAVSRKSVRVGVHLCDVVVQANGDLLGHGVNIAARLQQKAEPGTIVASVDIQRAVRGALGNRLHPSGTVLLEKLSETIEVFTLEAVAATARSKLKHGEHLLAVLPFDNDSGDEAMDYFSDGVADEIIHALMRHSSLKVIGRTSAFQFRGPKKTDAAAVLKASHVLDGAVHREGPRLRVRAQLIESRNGVAMWSERYEGEVERAFDLQDDIAAKVGAALKHAFTPQERSEPIDPAAYDLYLRARNIWLTLSDIDEEQAETLLMRCVELAPNFAPGWAGLASVRAFLLPRDRDIIGQPMHAAAVEAAETALEIDPDCPSALGALSMLKPAFAEHGEKLRLVDEALRRSPNDPALLMARAGWLWSVGRVREALASAERAQKLDPIGPVIESVRAALLMANGRPEEAVDVARAAWARYPDSAFCWYIEGLLYCAAGRLDEADALTAKGVPPKRGVSVKDVRVLQSHIDLLKMGVSERRAACMTMLEHADRAPGSLVISSCMTAAAFGCADEAFDALFKALDSGRQLRADPHDGFGMARAQSALQIFVNTGGTPFYRSNRFPALCARLGLVDYWLESGCWPDCADDVAYDFRVECERLAP